MSEGESITTPEYMLTTLALGFSLADLEYITIGMVLDLCAEKAGTAACSARQRDMDAF
jgi:hypothetical protein